MWEIARATFLKDVRSALLDAWSTAFTAPPTPNLLLPETYAIFSTSLPPPHTTGLLFALFHQIAAALPIQLIQGPTPTEHDRDIDAISDFTLNYCAATGLREFPPEAIHELRNAITHTLQVMYSTTHPGGPDAERTRVQILASPHTDAKEAYLEHHGWAATTTYLRALIKSHMPLFHARWSIPQFEHFIAGFEAGSAANVHLVLRLRPRPALTRINWNQYFITQDTADFEDEEYDSGEYDDSESDDSDSDSEAAQDGFELDILHIEYTPTGPRIPLSSFCTPLPPSTLPADTLCSICTVPVHTFPPGDEAVATSCNHFFHAECLGAWVNESAVRSANTCPQCRKVMCVARGRAPVGAFEDGEGASEGDDEGEGEGEFVGEGDGEEFL